MDEKRSAEGVAALHRALKAEAAGRLHEASGHATSAREAFDEAGDPTGGAAARQLLGSVLARGGRAQEAVAVLREAVPLRSGSGDREGQASLLHDLVRVHLQHKDVAGAVEAAREAADAWEKAGDREAKAAALKQLAELLVAGGHLEEAERVCADVAWLLDRPGDERERVGVLTLQSRIALARRDAQAALKQAMDAVQVAERARYRPVHVDALANLADVRGSVGDLPEARRLWLDVLDGRIVLRDGEGKLEALQALASLERSLGHGALAADRMRQAARLLEEQSQPHEALGCWYGLAELEAEEGRLEEAVAAGAEVVRLAALVGDAADQGAAWTAQGQRLARKGDADGAEAAFRSAVEVQSGPEAAAGRGVALAMLGQLLQALDRTDEAREAYDRAAGALGAVDPDAAAQVEALRRELG